MNENLPVTGVGIAVALAVVVAGSFMFFGPALLNLFSPGQQPLNSLTQKQPANPQTSMNDATSTPLNDITPADIPASITELSKKDVVVGTGEEAKEGDTVSVQYVGMLTNGQVFDASANHGGQPISFPLSKGSVIDGWVQGVAGMKVGGRRILVIPSELGYGQAGNGPIPPNANLVFEVELVAVQHGS